MVDKENIKIKFDEYFKKTFKKIDNSYKIKVKNLLSMNLINYIIISNRGLLFG